jgi:hypothetical protein
MSPIRELRRLGSPAPRPQSLAWDGRTLWMGSRQTKQIHGITPETWTVTWLTEAPGTPWGMTCVGPSEIRVLCGETENDWRIVRRLMPGKGFDPEFKLPCPEDTGSQLGWDGQRLYISQWYLRRVLALAADGSVERVIPCPHQICGQTIVGSKLYLMTTEDEETTDYWLTRIDLDAPELAARDVARVGFAARALAFDGEAFWTNHREAHQIVRFALPAAL